VTDRSRRAHERQLHWVVIHIAPDRRGHGNCGDVGHRHATDDEAFRCPWDNGHPAACCTGYVRQVLLEPGQIVLRGILC
jgi:hypothetical protein